MATENPKNTPDMGEQAIALAEQFGRVAGTIQGTAEAWVHRQQLTDQLTRVRDGATEMLKTLEGQSPQGTIRVEAQAGENGTRDSRPQGGRGACPRKTAPQARPHGARREEIGPGDSENAHGGGGQATAQVLRLVLHW